jgi:hypothetical protein
MGEPHDDIVTGQHIAGAHPVSWCVVEQRWIS